MGDPGSSDSALVHPTRGNRVALLRSSSWLACAGGGVVAHCVSAPLRCENPFRATAFAGLTPTRSARRVSVRPRARSWQRTVMTGSVGSPADIAGAVARAMERAYREGFVDAQGEPPMPSSGEVRTAKTIDWALILPRPRTALWTICLFVLGRGERTDGEGHLVRASTERETAGWRPMLPRGNFEPP